MFKSPNSVLNKSRTRLLNKQRILSRVVFFTSAVTYKFLLNLVLAMHSQPQSVHGVDSRYIFLVVLHWILFIEKYDIYNLRNIVQSVLI